MSNATNQGPSSSTSELPWQAVWRLRVSTIVWAFLGLGCLLALPILFDATPLVVVAVAILALLIGAILAWTSRRFLSRSGTGGFTPAWLKASLASFFVISIALAAPIYYFAISSATNPALLPRVTLSNGEKTVIFQGMVHVGSEQFYKSVVYDAEQAISDGYVLYYEGVQPNPAADKWFSDNLAGGGDLRENYKTLSEVCGLKFQLDYFKLLEKDFDKHPDIHIKADVDVLDMKQEYERLIKSDPEFAAAMKEKPKAGTTVADSSATDWILHGTKGQKKLAGYVCRWMLGNVMNKGKGEEEDQMKKVILHFRNRKLADRIVADSHDKIYITYGSDHIRGVVEILQENDPAWVVKSVTWARPVDAPRHHQGTL